MGVRHREDLTNSSRAPTALLPGGGAELNCVDADTMSPTVVISSDAVAPVTGPFSIAIAFSEPVTGFENADFVVGNGSASALQGNRSIYSATIAPVASGAVTVDIAAGAAEDDAGNPSVAAERFSIVADLTQVPVKMRGASTRARSRSRPSFRRWPPWSSGREARS